MNNSEILKKEDYLEPETIRQLKGSGTTSLDVLKELVIKIISNTNAAFVDFYVFENVVHVLNNLEPDVEKLEGTTPEQIWLALLKIAKLRPDFELRHEVQMYIRFVFKNAGIAFLPPYAGKENPNLLQVVKRAQKGNIIESSEDPLEIQAIHYLRIQEYLKKHNIT